MLAISISDMVAIVDKLLELFKLRKQQSKELFESVIVPIFDQLLLVHADYIEMFEQVRADLKNPEVELSLIISKLGTQRLEFEPVRIKLRMLSHEYREYQSKKGNGPIADFIEAVVLYFPSGNVFTDDPSSSSDILTQLENAELKQRVSAPAFEESRAELEKNVSRTLLTHRRSWSIVCESYAKAKIHYLM